MFDPDKFTQMMQMIQQNPQMLDQVAEQLAQNPQMQPPPPGSMKQAMQGLMIQGGGEAMPAQVQPGQQAPAPLAEGMSLGDIIGGSQAPMTPEQMIQSQNVAAIPGGTQIQNGGVPGQALNPLAALEGPPPQQAFDPVYIGNLAFGAATPAKGLNLQYTPGRMPGSLGEYL